MVTNPPLASRTANAAPQQPPANAGPGAGFDPDHGTARGVTARALPDRTAAGRPVEARMHLQVSAPAVWLPLAILMGVPAGAPAWADETLPGNAIQGAELAREFCAACHFVDKGGRGVSATGAPSFQDVADDPAVTAIALGVFFRSPHETMPDLILSRAETDNAIAYILSLK